MEFLGSTVTVSVTTALAHVQETGFLQDFYEFLWIPTGFLCFPMGSYGFLWIPMDMAHLNDNRLGLSAKMSSWLHMNTITP